jgi:hypothetical protein
MAYIFVKNRDIKNPKTCACSWGCLLSIWIRKWSLAFTPSKIGRSCLMSPPFSKIENGRRSAILNLTSWQIIQIVTLTCSLPLISMSDQLKQIWLRYNMKCSKIAKKGHFWPIFSTPGGHLEFFQNFEKTCIIYAWYFTMPQSFREIPQAISEIWWWTDGREVFLYPPLGSDKTPRGITSCRFLAGRFM